MAGILGDTEYRVIQDGIKEDIEVAYTHGRFRAALILIYSAMDSMAYLDLPEGRQYVLASDFIRWADRYIKFPCPLQVTAEELYGARCGLLHTSRVESKRSEQGKCRLIGYANAGIPEVRYNSNVNPNFVMVSILGLKNAFFAGINEFLIAAFSSGERRPLIEARLETMVQTFPVEPAQN